MRILSFLRSHHSTLSRRVPQHGRPKVGDNKVGGNMTGVTVLLSSRSGMMTVLQRRRKRNRGVRLHNVTENPFEEGEQ